MLKFASDLPDLEQGEHLEVLGQNPLVRHALFPSPQVQEGNWVQMLRGTIVDQR